MSMNIGTLISLLERCPSTARVKFGFSGFAPTTVSSWRGVYAEAAIEYKQHHEITVAQLIAELNKATMNTYHGYKGGEYTYHIHTPIHVDNWGEWTGTEITAVQIVDDDVILITGVE